MLDQLDDHLEGGAARAHHDRRSQRGELRRAARQYPRHLPPAFEMGGTGGGFVSQTANVDDPSDPGRRGRSHQVLGRPPVADLEPNGAVPGAHRMRQIEHGRDPGKGNLEGGRVEKVPPDQTRARWQLLPGPLQVPHQRGDRMAVGHERRNEGPADESRGAHDEDALGVCRLRLVLPGRRGSPPAADSPAHEDRSLLERSGA